MISRKEKFKKKKLFGLNRYIAGTLLTFAIIFSSITVSFAHQDIEVLLSDWFAKKKDSAVSEINEAVNKEKEHQTKHLRRELDKKIKEAEKELNQFTKSEKDKTVKAIRQYADQLIKGFSVDSKDEANRITTEFGQILNEAIQKMDQVQPNAPKASDASVNPPVVKEPADKNSSKLKTTNEEPEPKEEATPPVKADTAKPQQNTPSEEESPEGEE